tara:strand:- start:2063 stop:2251 length:189 start_codon:yes stop_codon:yes gene_type:complete
MSEALVWFGENKEAIIGIITGIVTVASVIATMTPNDSDNAFVAKVSKVVSWLALNLGKAKSG